MGETERKCITCRSEIEKLNSVGINNESIFGLVKYEDLIGIFTGLIFQPSKYEDLKGEMRDEIKELENISPNLDVSFIANDFKEIFYLNS